MIMVHVNLPGCSQWFFIPFAFNLASPLFFLVAPDIRDRTSKKSLEVAWATNIGMNFGRKTREKLLEHEAINKALLRETNG